MPDHNQQTVDRVAAAICDSDEYPGYWDHMLALHEAEGAFTDTIEMFRREARAALDAMPQPPAPCHCSPLPAKTYQRGWHAGHVAALDALPKPIGYATITSMSLGWPDGAQAGLSDPDITDMQAAVDAFRSGARVALIPVEPDHA